MKVEIKNKISTGYEVEDLKSKKVYILSVDKANIGDRFVIINPLFWMGNKYIILDKETIISKIN